MTNKKEFDEFIKKLYKQHGKKEVDAGLEVEKEHDNVTKGDRVKTLKIAAAHLKEVPDYYDKLKKYVED